MSGLPVSNEKHVYDNILGAIGQTPLVRLGRVRGKCASSDLCQVGKFESGREHQGSRRLEYHRAGRTARRIQTRRHNRRSHIG